MRRALTDYDYILKTIGVGEILGQLEEKCAELIQAASKLRRALSEVNSTPVTVEEATKQILEEFADVCLCAKMLGYRGDSISVEEIQERKTLRWISRINQNHGAQTDNH